MDFLLVALYVACELIANVTAAKPVVLPLGLAVPAAVFIYALTFTLVDLINERLGRHGARQAVYAGFAANLLLVAYAQFAICLPAPEWWAGQGAFVATLSSTWRVVAASLTAYLLSSLADVQVFAWWREWVGVRFAWARVLVSNAVSTLIDSTVFVTVAFLGVMPVLPLIAGQYVVKMVMTLVSIPLIYTVRDAGRVEVAL